jgi:hypothetical protein
MSGPSRPARCLSILALAAVFSGEGGRGAAGASPEALRVRTSEAFAPCLTPALEAFSRESGLPSVLDVGDPDPPGEADVVVGDDSELTRLLEGGGADLSSAFDLGSLPWVYIVPEHRAAALSASVLDGAERVHVLGGRAGRDARASLGRLASRVRVTRDGGELRQAEYALLPRSLAGPGEQSPAPVPALVATAALVASSPRPAAARSFLAFLKGPRGRASVSACLVDASQASTPAPPAAEGAAYAAEVVDWWAPDCSLQRNRYNDPRQVLGTPNAANLGGKDLFRGMMSLGQGGFVTVDMGVSAVDGPGPDIRVYQTVSAEKVTLYAATGPQGPFALVGLLKRCGERSNGLYSNHCDFDLHDAGQPEARYLKIEDGEIYPCLAGDTLTEGADIDAIQLLNSKP